ncbi:MAG: VOC family protein [Gemmataceae bacterium]|jgi:catechol 2,3-dioxygenase-like lactoylglutathione lyase family enzyme|nr:VOC family protein [Gemmataceae bacterium]
MGLPVTHIDHCTVIITDVALAREFYGKKLGLKEIAPPKSFDFVALWYDLGTTYLHLLLKPHADTESARHFCFHVSDIQYARTYLTQQGLTLEETVKIRYADRFFIRDPFGNRIEILQWEYKYDPNLDGRYLV